MDNWSFILEIKDFWFFELVEKMCREVAACKRGMSMCRLIRSLKDSALSLRSCLTLPQTGYKCDD